MKIVLGFVKDGSSEADIMKELTLRFPRYHAMSTSHIGWKSSKSYCIDDGSPRFDHLVFTLLSRVFWGMFPSLPVAPTAVIVGVLHSAGVGAGVGGNPAFTSTSVILDQLFSVFPVTVILIYLPMVSGTLYDSSPVVLPLLCPENIGAKLIPSLDTEIVKLFTRRSPLYHATSTLQIGWDSPKLYWIHEGNPRFDHLVLILLSKVF